MAAKWWRYNSTSHIFEQSLNEGDTWTIPPLNASIITEGVFDSARLGGNLAYTDVANVFTKDQTITGNASVALQFGVSGVVSFYSTLYVQGTINSNGGSGTDYANASIRINSTATPRIAFHWPGIAANQILMTSDGVLRFMDANGLGYASVAAFNYYSSSTGNSLGDLTVRAGTNFIGGVTTSGGNIIGQAGYFQMLSVMYPGRIDVGVMQGSWYLGSHASWGLYSNTGVYFVGPVYGQVYLNHGGYFGFIKSHALTYTNPNALDDYEEGEWTPTVEFDSGEAEYTERNASYTKIGRLVFVAGRVVLSSKGTGKARVIDLPFIPEHRVSGPRYLPDLEVNQPAYFEFSYQAPT